VIFAHLARLGLGTALLGVARNGLHRRCRSFVAYLVAVFVCGSLITLWPDHFYTWAFYSASRDLYAFLKVLVAAELGVHVFRAFPRARAIERTATLLLLLVLLVLVLGVSPHAPEPWLEWHRRLNVGTLWVFASSALLVAWYNLPLDRWHAAIVGGFTVQLVLQTVVLARWDSYALSIMIDPLVAGWWAFAAWRPAPELAWQRYIPLYSDIPR
jgi:hypothetical protein